MIMDSRIDVNVGLIPSGHIIAFEGEYGHIADHDYITCTYTIAINGRKIPNLHPEQLDFVCGETLDQIFLPDTFEFDLQGRIFSTRKCLMSTPRKSLQMIDRCLCDGKKKLNMHDHWDLLICLYEEAADIYNYNWRETLVVMAAGDPLETSTAHIYQKCFKFYHKLIEMNLAHKPISESSRWDLARWYQSVAKLHLEGKEHFRRVDLARASFQKAMWHLERCPPSQHRDHILGQHFTFLRGVYRSKIFQKTFEDSLKQNRHDIRCLACTHYQYGRWLMHQNELEKAVVQLKKALDIELELRERQRHIIDGTQMVTMVLTLLNRKKEAKKFLSTMIEDPRFKPHMDVVKHMHQMSQTKRGFMNLKAMFKNYHESECKEHQALPPMPKEMAKFMRNTINKKSCAVCGVEHLKLFLCARCESIRYCSAEHQKEDWPRHKANCKRCKKKKKKETRV